jgi:D-serine deaminase-like pyridoxal phosphate-dependent protein
MLSAAARAAGVEIGVLAELDVGMARCGVDDSAALLELAGQVGAAEGLCFRGLQGYEGHACFITDAGERRRAAEAAAGKLAGARRDLEAAGVGVDIVSAGGTGTYDVTGLIEGIDELQVGSYALMDGRYRTVRQDFENALFLLSSVLSVHGERAVFDVGYKSAGAEMRPPAVVGLDGEPGGFKLNEEHLRLDGVGGRFRVGQKVRMIPWHGCTTCNLYPRFHVVDGEEVVDEWAIEGAGLRS